MTSELSASKMSCIDLNMKNKKLEDLLFKLISILLIFLRLFWGENVRVLGYGRQGRGRWRVSQADSLLSGEPDTGFDLMTLRS